MHRIPTIHRMVPLRRHPQQERHPPRQHNLIITTLIRNILVTCKGRCTHKLRHTGNLSLRPLDSHRGRSRTWQNPLLRMSTGGRHNHRHQQRYHRICERRRSVSQVLQLLQDTRKPGLRHPYTRQQWLPATALGIRVGLNHRHNQQNHDRGMYRYDAYNFVHVVCGSTFVLP